MPVYGRELAKLSQRKKPAYLSRPRYRSAYQLAGNWFSPRKTKVWRQSG